jgi:hypothetical protein
LSDPPATSLPNGTLNLLPGVITMKNHLNFNMTDLEFTRYAALNARDGAVNALRRIENCSREKIPTEGCITLVRNETSFRTIIALTEPSWVADADMIQLDAVLARIGEMAH